MRTLAVVAITLAAMFFGAPVAARAETNEAAVAAAAQLRDAYWIALNEQHYDIAYAMYAPSTQAMISRDQFVGYEQQNRRDNGANIERRVMRTTVYVNPQGAPVPGVYVAFDFVGRFEAADRHCGYVILHQAEADDPFRIVRSDQTFLDNASAARSREQGQSVDDIWAQMAASYCPGWQREWAIQPPV